MIVLIVAVETKFGNSTILSLQKGNTWINMSPTTNPQPRSDFKAVYDVKADKIIIFSGLQIFVGKYQDTWSYDFNTNLWTNMSSDNMPLAREAYSMAYDEESDRTVLFSGVKIGPWEWICWNETWSFDYESNSWTFMDLPIQPSGRLWADMVYDKGSDRIILFGGFSKDTMYADTWAYNFNTNEWINMTPSIQPSPRWGHRMTYDEESDLVILFGGSIALPSPPVTVRDTWTYDYDTNTWVNVTSSTSPQGSVNHDLTYDTKSDRVIFYGGGDDNLINKGETWIYDVNTNRWSNKTPITSPEPRRRSGMAYDEESDRTILFGGCFDDFSLIDETWAYDYQTSEGPESSTSSTTSKEPESSTSKPTRIPSLTLELAIISFSIFGKQLKRKSKNKSKFRFE